MYASEAQFSHLEGYTAEAESYMVKCGECGKHYPTDIFEQCPDEEYEHEGQTEGAATAAPSAEAEREYHEQVEAYTASGRRADDTGWYEHQGDDREPFEVRRRRSGGYTAIIRRHPSGRHCFHISDGQRTRFNSRRHYDLLGTAMIVAGVQLEQIRRADEHLRPGGAAVCAEGGAA